MYTANLKANQPVFYHTVIEKIQKSKKVQHAYLIETNAVLNSESYIIEFVEQLFSLKLDQKQLSREKLHKCLLNHTFLDLKVLKTVSNIIKKEDLLALKSSFSEKSFYGGYQIYIIYDAEKLNSSSANTILKFLEEPEDDIIAVLVTENRYKILETILSRCQILSFTSEGEKIDFSSQTVDFLDLLVRRKENDLILSYKKISENIFYDKETSSMIFGELFSFFDILLKIAYEIISEVTDETIKKYQHSFKPEEILKFLVILDQKMRELQYNINLKSWLDSVLLMFMEV